MLAYGSLALEREDAVATGTFPASETFFVHLNERDIIKARTPGRMTLQWIPQGRLAFLYGMVGSTLTKLGVSIKSLIFSTKNLSQGILDGFLRPMRG